MQNLYAILRYHFFGELYKEKNNLNLDFSFYLAIFDRAYSKCLDDQIKEIKKLEAISEKKDKQ